MSEVEPVKPLKKFFETTIPVGWKPCVHIPYPAQYPFALKLCLVHHHPVAGRRYMVGMIEGIATPVAIEKLGPEKLDGIEIFEGMGRQYRLFLCFLCGSHRGLTLAGYEKTGRDDNNFDLQGWIRIGLK